MTNPLLTPDDRFKPKKIGEADANPFSEGDAVLEAEASSAARQQNAFAPAATDSSRPFLPQYEVTVGHRAWLLLLLDLISFFAGFLGVLVLLIGWILPLTGLVPAGLVVFLAADDLRTMRSGGRDPAGRPLTILALILAVLLTLGIGAMCGLFYYWKVPLIPLWMQG